VEEAVETTMVTRGGDVGRRRGGDGDGGEDRGDEDENGSEDGDDDGDDGGTSGRGVRE